MERAPMIVFHGPIKDNEGKEVIAANRRRGETDIALEDGLPRRRRKGAVH